MTNLPAMNAKSLQRKLEASCRIEMAPVGFLTLFVNRLGRSAAQDRPPLAGRPAWLGESEQPLTGDRLADQAQGDLRALVGLGEHRGAGLDQDVPAGELRALLGHVHIGDAAVGGFEVGLVDREDFRGEAEAALLSAVL